MRAAVQSRGSTIAPYWEGTITVVREEHGSHTKPAEVALATGVLSGTDTSTFDGVTTIKVNVEALGSTVSYSSKVTAQEVTRVSGKVWCRSAGSRMVSQTTTETVTDQLDGHGEGRLAVSEIGTDGRYSISFEVPRAKGSSTHDRSSTGSGGCGDGKPTKHSDPSEKSPWTNADGGDSMGITGHAPRIGKGKYPTLSSLRVLTGKVVIPVQDDQMKVIKTETWHLVRKTTNPYPLTR
jgi:hypothetical protein